MRTCFTSSEGRTGLAKVDTGGVKSTTMANLQSIDDLLNVNGSQFASLTKEIESTVISDGLLPNGLGRVLTKSPTNYELQGDVLGSSHTKSPKMSATVPKASQRQLLEEQFQSHIGLYHERDPVQQVSIPLQRFPPSFVETEEADRKSTCLPPQNMQELPHSMRTHGTLPKNPIPRDLDFSARKEAHGWSPRRSAQPTLNSTEGWQKGRTPGLDEFEDASSGYNEEAPEKNHIDRSHFERQPNSKNSPQIQEGTTNGRYKLQGWAASFLMQPGDKPSPTGKLKNQIASLYMMNAKSIATLRMQRIHIYKYSYIYNQEVVVTTKNTIGVHLNMCLQ